MKGYVVVFEGDDASGYSAYSPDLPGVIAAGDTTIGPHVSDHRAAHMVSRPVN